MQKFLWFVVLCGVGSVFVMVPLALGGLEVMLHFGIQYMFRLVEGGGMWTTWQKIPIPVYLRIRFFNITNHKDFVYKGDKPKLQEVGPYVYRETIEKVDIKVDGYTDLIRYRQVRHYFFEPKMSRGKESDLINMINVAFVTMAKTAHELTDEASVLETLEDTVVKKGERLWRTHTVKEILFDGFQVKNFVELTKDPTGQSANFTLHPKLMDGKLGLFEGRNGTDEGWIEVKSGSRSSDDFARMATYKGASVLKKWRGPPCNAIKGTDGMFHQPFLSPKLKLGAFVPELCRSLDLDYEKTADHNGIASYRFSVPQKTFFNAEKNKDNLCFCPSEDTASCPPQGIFMTNCFEGAPFVISNPHFFWGEKSMQKFEGIKANQTKHLTFTDLHPMTGLVIEAKLRTQFNIELRPYDTMKTFNNVPKMYLPILWVDEGGELEDMNKTLLKLLDFGLKLWGFGKWVAIVFWILVTAGAIALIIYNRKNSRVELIEENDDDDE